MNKEIIIQSINYLQALLSRFNQTLNGTKNNFTPLEISDLSEILGFEEEEIKEVIG